MFKMNKELLNKKDKFLEILNDNRFNTLNNGNLIFSLWFLTNSKSSYLIYGRVLPSTNPKTSYKWKKRNIGQLLKSNKNWEINNISIVQSFEKIKNIISNLLDGLPFKEVNSVAGIESIKMFDGWIFNSTDEKEEHFVISEPIFTEANPVSKIYKLQPLTSPHNAISAWSLSLFRLNKLEIFTKVPKTELDKVIIGCIEVLNDETGQDWKGSDINRLGNIDLFSFNFMDSNECSSVQTSFEEELNKNYEKLFVEIAPNATAMDIELLINCRLITNIGILHDETQKIILTKKGSKITFNNLPAIGICYITISKLMDNGTYTLLFSCDHTPLRSIAGQIGIVELSGTVSSEWLEEINSKELKDRVSKIKNLKKIRYQPSFVGSPPSHIQNSINKASNIAKVLFPKKSGGKFFTKGWFGEKHGKLELFEWFNEITKRPQPLRLVIIDPYIDNASIELFIRAEVTNHFFNILTNTQIPSIDEEGNEITYCEGVPKRAERIMEMCKENRLFLERNNLKILDLRSGNKKQLFHDRYIIIYDSNDIVLEGYTLSNSIQGATKNHPMLVSPIAQDLLYDVADYAMSLWENNNNSIKNAKLYELYNSQQIKSKHISVESRDDGFYLELSNKLSFKNFIINTYNLGIRFISGFSIKFLKNLNIHKLVLYSNKNIIENFKLGFKAHILQEVINIDSDIYYRTIIKIIEKMSKSEPYFLKMWPLFCVWFANTPDCIFIQKIKNNISTNLSNPISKFIKKHIYSEVEKTNEEINVYTHYFQENNIYKLSHQAKHLITHPIRDYKSRDWSLHFACEILTKYHFQSFIKIFEDFNIQVERKIIKNQEIGLKHITNIGLKFINDTINCIREFNSTYISALISSDFLLFRVLGAYSISPNSINLRNKFDIDKNINLLINLKDDFEKLFFVSEWLYDLKVEENREVTFQKAKNTDLKHYKDKLYKLLVDNWKSDITYKQLKNLTNNLSGPIRGSASSVITSKLLIPLYEKELISSTNVTDLWVDLLINAIQGTYDGTDQFYSNTHKELTETTANLLAGNFFQENNKLDNFLKLLKTARHFFWRPFASSINYDKWANCAGAIAWIAILLKLFLSKCEENKKDMQIVNKYSAELEKLSVEIDKLKCIQLPFVSFSDYFKEIFK